MIEFQPPLRNCSIQHLTLPLMSPLNLSKVAVKLFCEGKTKGGTSTEQGLDQACIDVANTNLINANNGIINGIIIAIFHICVSRGQGRGKDSYMLWRRRDMINNSDRKVFFIAVDLSCFDNQ